MQLFKHLILFLVGAIVYMLIELGWRGYTHWSMGIVGGICFVILGLINEVLPWEIPLWVQALIGSVAITILEFISGYVLNICFRLNIWDYSNMYFNIYGQICLVFTVMWFILSFPAILLDDMIRWKFFDEEKPRYTLK